MKRLLSLCLFALIVTSNVQITDAQTINSINESCLQKAKELQSKIKFNDAVLKKVQQAYVEYDGRIASLNSLAKSNRGNRFGNKKHLLKIKLQKTVKAAFDNDEVLFEKYLAVTNQHNYTKLVEKPERSKTISLVDRNPTRTSSRLQRTPSKTVILKEKRH